MGILTTILYVILFIVLLSVLIIVHELGHLTAAKVFNVYCLEFSCGMGPLIWKHKKANGETQISLRAIPFGGYVSMYGEGVELPEGVTVDESRSLHGIKKWKQAIVLVAGVVMNAILALVIFFIGNVACEQKTFEYTNKIAVMPNSICETAGLVSEDYLSFDDAWKDSSAFMLKDVGTITFTDNSTKDIRVTLQYASSYKEPVYAYTFYGYEGGKVVTSISYTENIKSVSFNLQTKTNDVIVDHPVVIDFIDGKMPDCGLRVYVKNFRYTFGEAVVQTFKDFGNSSTIIVDSLGMIFTGEVEVSQLSGIVGIGFEAKTILDDLGVAKFIYLWGLISVNLAIFNLLPFPGLDGWQLFVVIVEGITRKKIPDKVKNIVSLIGLAILFLFMFFILFKDIWVYVLGGLVLGL